MSHLKTGRVYLVGAGPGDEGLLTLRGVELLSRADVIIHDALLNPRVLRHARPAVEIIPVATASGERLRTQEEVIRLMIERARAGHTVVRLKGGDPYVFGRGGEEATEILAAGVSCEVVPGVSSFSAVPACAGIPLTHRLHASAFTVVTGHEDPAKPGTAIDWQQVARIHGTKVLMMAVDKLPAITAALIEGGLAASTPAAAVRWGTTASQTTVIGTLSDIADKVAEAGMESPAVVIIGDVVRLREQLNWFETRPLFGRRIVVTRAREQAGGLAARLSELGAQVLEVPTIRVGPPSERQPMVESLAGLGEYDWIIFSSVHGVDAFFNGLLAAYEDIRAFGNLRIAAVGPATAARIRELHLRVDAVPTEFVGRNIAAAIREVESLENLRVLLARAEVASPDLCRELENQGAIVDDVAFYRTLPESEENQGDLEVIRESGADWITFTSASTVEQFHAREDLPTLVRKFPRLRLASIGPETSKALAKLGLKPAAEARPHTIDGLIAALLDAD